jgi:short-subunit dehydrogenase
LYLYLHFALGLFMLLAMSIEGSGGLHIIITGASSGIGAATARTLVAAGHRLVLAARREDVLEALVNELNPSGKRVIGVPCDVRNHADLERLVARARATFGAVQVVFNNAGLDSGGQSWWKRSAADVNAMYETNVLAPYWLSQLVLPEMLSERNGQIINMGSVQGTLALSSLYGASKFALRGMSLALHRELKGTGVNVSLLTAGFVRTAMTQKGGKRPLPMIEPEQIAQTVLRLLEYPKPEVVVPSWYQPLIWLEHLIPTIGDMVVQRSWKKDQ